MSERSDDTQISDEASCDIKVVDSALVSRVRERLPGSDRIDGLSGIFDALSDPTRLRILIALTHGELCVCDLSAVAGISQSGVSHQLRVLRDRGLVTYSRDGKRAVYRLADDHVRILLDQGMEHAEERFTGTP